MIDNKTKELAKAIVEDTPNGLVQEEYTTTSESILENMPDDARALWDAAMEKEFLRREGSLEENDRKYEAAIMQVLINKEGELEKGLIVYHKRWENGTEYIKLNAFGYDRLPQDVQAIYGQRDNVVENWIPQTNEMKSLYNAYVAYAYQDNEGHSTWEEYRDAKGFAPKQEVSEKITIEPAEHVDENAPPLETPAIADDTENLIKR